MSDHLTEERLNQLAEGSLEPAERADAERHVAACATCRAEVEGLRALRRDAAALPRSIQPPRDLWAGIQPRLAVRPSGRPTVRLYLLAAAAVLVLAVGAVLWRRPSAGEWAMAGGGALRVGEWLETDDSSRVRLLVGQLGAVQVEAGTRVRLIEARRGEHRLELARGTIQAHILAKPRVFIVETPSATAVDLGCAYALTVDSLGNGLLHVTSGWVEFTWGNRSTVVPRDAFAATRPGAGPGTAYAADATPALRRALEAFDVSGGGDTAVRTVLAAARPTDALTLMNLIPRVDGALRGVVFDRLAELAPPPARVTRDGILALDATMIERWWDRIAPPRLEKFDPEQFGPPTVKLEPRS